LNGLDFLTPEAGSDSVIARTPMERLARAAGSRFERRDGWSVAVSFGDPASERERMEQTVAFADRSHLVKLELHAQPEVLAAVVSAAAGGLELEPRLAARAEDAWWCPVTPSHVLVLGEPDVGRELRESIAAAVAEAADDAGPTVTVADVTCGLCGMALIGPGAGELLARFCAIDVRPAVTPVRGFRPGSVARTPGFVLREAEQRLLVLVGWALGEYLFDVVADAAEHLGGGPVGADALRRGAAVP
jgi:heterotetrameric sarcosine oxidase gamma subunit